MLYPLSYGGGDVRHSLEQFTERQVRCKRDKVGQEGNADQVSSKFATWELNWASRPALRRCCNQGRCRA